MRSRSRNIVAATGLLLLAACRAESQVTTPADLEHRVESLLHAYQTADPVAVGSFYDGDAVVLIRGNLLKGAEQIGAALRSHFAQLVTQSFNLDVLETIQVDDGHAITSAVGTTRGSDPSGDVIFSGAIAVSIHWRLRGEEWSIVYTHEEFTPDR